MTAIEALERAYRRARYRVELDDGPLELRVSEPNAELAALLASRGVRGAAFLTACNPGSRRLDEAANRAAQAALLEALTARGHPTLPAVAVDPDGRWPDEESVLVLGIEAAAAAALARRFGQNAMLWIDARGVPELVWVDAAR